MPKNDNNEEEAVKMVKRTIEVICECLNFNDIDLGCARNAMMNLMAISYLDKGNSYYEYKEMMHKWIEDMKPHWEKNNG